MPTTLVLGYDGSDCAKKALAHTVELAGTIDDADGVRRLRVRVLHRLRPHGHDRLAAHDERRVRPARGPRARLRRAAGRGGRRGARRPPACTPSGEVARASPVDVLLEAAREKQAAAIVVGSHGEGAVSAAFLGSTALKLLHHSDIPVLVVPRHDKKLTGPRHGRAPMSTGASRDEDARQAPRRDRLGPRVRPPVEIQAHVRLPRVLHRRQHVRRRLAGDADAAPAPRTTAPRSTAAGGAALRAHAGQAR